MLRVFHHQEGSAERAHAAYLSTTAPVFFGDGFYDSEQDDFNSFRWLSGEGALSFEPDEEERFLELPVYSDFHDLSQLLTVSSGNSRSELALCHTWHLTSVSIPAGAVTARFEANKVLPRSFHINDHRTLAVRIGEPRLHADPERHRHVIVQYRNSIHNREEMLAGKTRLRSTPPYLGTDMHGACNVKPPCVYCDWDRHKDLEDEFVDAPFTGQTLAEWGPFFDNAGAMINCSIGEPFMMKNLDELLDIFGDRSKLLELTTNGQILTDRNIEKLLGRHVYLYISLDAATPETYAKLRNDRFETILDNLRRLVAAKGGRTGFPRIFLVFMPMRVNQHELEDFVRLCADLGVDRMMLRPLNHADELQLDWERNGHQFVYQEELLPFSELVRISGRAAELCERYGVNLTDQLDFGGRSMEELFREGFEEGRNIATTESSPQVPGIAGPSEPQAMTLDEELSPSPIANENESSPTLHASEVTAAPAESEALGQDRVPICQEPWENLYILRRGILPCCYGHSPLAPMDGYREVWNSRPLQAIRRALAAGRFHSYCLRSTSCPVVRKWQHRGRLPFLQDALLRARHQWHRFDRVLYGVPGRVAGPVLWVGVRIGRAVRDPAYLPRHIARLVRWNTPSPSSASSQTNPPSGKERRARTPD
jgi:MoaA/NifB/PqqE/SkfB family radical SAM enzyme